MAKTTSKGCPYCNKKDKLYVRRTSPMVVMGCHRCEKTAKFLKDKGLSKNEILKVLGG